MLIDVTKAMKDYENEPLTMSTMDPRPYTYRQAMLVGLNNATEIMDADKKVKAFELSCKIAREDKPDIDTAESGLILETSGVYHTPLVHGRLKALLDGTGLVAVSDLDDDDIPSDDDLLPPQPPPRAGGTAKKK